MRLRAWRDPMRSGDCPIGNGMFAQPEERLLVVLTIEELLEDLLEYSIV